MKTNKLIHRLPDKSNGGCGCGYLGFDIVWIGASCVGKESFVRLCGDCVLGMDSHGYYFWVKQVTGFQWTATMTGLIC